MVKIGKSSLLQMENSPIKHIYYWKIVISGAALKHDASTNLPAKEASHI